jgi:hypothetical protein
MAKSNKISASWINAGKPRHSKKRKGYMSKPATSRSGNGKKIRRF